MHETKTAFLIFIAFHFWNLGDPWKSKVLEKQPRWVQTPDHASWAEHVAPAVAGALRVWALLRRPGLSSWSCPFFLTVPLPPFLPPHYFLLCFSFLLVLVSVSVTLSVHSGEKFSEQLSFLWAVTNIPKKPFQPFWRRVLSPGHTFCTEEMEQKSAALRSGHPWRHLSGFGCCPPGLSRGETSPAATTSGVLPSFPNLPFSPVSLALTPLHTRSIATLRPRNLCKDAGKQPWNIMEKCCWNSASVHPCWIEMDTEFRVK